VTIKGLVTRTSDVKPRIAVCTYTCDTCGCELFQDVLGSSYMPILKCPSQRCIDNKTPGKINFQARGSRFIKYQELRIQELPDQVPTGHIPRSMTIHCSGETTRQCGPGDIVTIHGVFLTVKYTGYRAITAGLQADTYLDAHHVEKQKLNFDALALRTDNHRMVMEIAHDLDPYGRLASSIAPEIFGHEDVKKALLLQLVGGVTR
jgi:DNA replication licensing factor MCM7